MLRVDVKLLAPKAGANEGKARYRMRVTDGQFATSLVLASQLGDMVAADSSKFQKGTIVRVTSLITNDGQGQGGRRVLIALAMEPVSWVPDILGNQVPMDASEAVASGHQDQNMPPHVNGGGVPTAAGGPTYGQPPPGSNNFGGGDGNNQYAAGGAAPPYQQQQFYGNQPATNNNRQQYGGAAPAPGPGPGPAYGAGAPGPGPSYGSSAYGGGGGGNAPYGGARQAAGLGPAQPMPGGGPRPGAPLGGKPQYGAAGHAVARDNGPARIVPIQSLNPYTGKWTIKARVTSKGDLKRFSNAKQPDGKLFSFDLLDKDGGEIRATCFGEVVSCAWCGAAGAGQPGSSSGSGDRIIIRRRQQKARSLRCHHAAAANFFTPGMG